MIYVTKQENLLHLLCSREPLKQKSQNHGALLSKWRRNWSIVNWDISRNSSSTVKLMFSETILRVLSQNQHLTCHQEIFKKQKLWCWRWHRLEMRHDTFQMEIGFEVNQDRDLVWNAKSYLVWNFLGNDLKDRCYEICRGLLCFMKVYTAMREIVRLVNIWGLVKFTVSKQINFETCEEEASRPTFAARLDVLLWNKLLVVSAMMHIS